MGAIDLLFIKIMNENDKLRKAVQPKMSMQNFCASDPRLYMRTCSNEAECRREKSSRQAIRQP